MDERHDPQTNAPDEGELLAAYLDAETDDLTSARIERLLQQDPQAIAKLDAIASVRARLQRLDDVVPPEGARERLDARLRAERTRRAEHRAARRAQVASRARWWNERLAPRVAVAALVILALVGAAGLLLPRGSSDSMGATAEEAGGAGEAPASAPRLGGEDNSTYAEGAEGAIEQDAGQPADTQAALELQRVRTDADIAARLDRRAQRTQDAAARETRLRRRAGMPTAPVCLSDIDATAVDLVELDGEPVLSALVPDPDGSKVALFDLQTCARLRTFTP